MKINDIMTHRASYVDADASLSEASRVMRADDVTYLPICDHDRVIGSITHQDIATRGPTCGSNPDAIPVRAIMSADPTSVFIDSDVCAVARLMERSHLRRLPVLNRKGCLVGVVSLGDIARGQYRCWSKGAHELSDALPSAV